MLGCKGLIIPLLILRIKITLILGTFWFDFICLFFFRKVEELIKKHKEELLKKRYKFNVGIIMGEFRIRLYSFTVSNEPLSPMNLLK